MKALSRTLTTCTAAAALLLATAGVAQAYDPDAPANDVAEAITAVAPGVTDVLAIAQADGAFVSTSGESAVIIPRNPSEPVEMTRTAPRCCGHCGSYALRGLRRHSDTGG